MRAKVSKIWAIHSGGDWNDASAEYVILLPGMDLEAEQKAWRDWYHDVFLAKFNTPNKVPNKTFVEWLIERGAQAPSKDQLEVWENP